MKKLTNGKNAWDLWRSDWSTIFSYLEMVMSSILDKNNEKDLS